MRPTIPRMIYRQRVSQGGDLEYMRVVLAPHNETFKSGTTAIQAIRGTLDQDGSKPG